MRNGTPHRWHANWYGEPAAARSLTSLEGGHAPIHVQALVDARDGALVFERAAAVMAAA
jgi:hypothetical protein